MDILDPLDQQLCVLLGENALQSSAELAKQLNVSPATVRRRMKNLIDNDDLHIVGVVKHAQFGLPVAIVLNLIVNFERVEPVLGELSQQPEIQWVSTCTGRYDIIAGGLFSSMAALSDFMKTVLTQIRGIKESETSVLMEQRKGGYERLRK